MKKLVSMLIVLTVLLSALAGCGGDTNGTTGTTGNNTPAVTEKEYALAIGVALTESLAKNKITETVATIVTDANNKIVLCRLDCVDYTAKYNEEDGSLITTAPVSKAAQGDSYMMNAGSWASQAAALEAYVVGKSQAEVAAIALEGGVATDAELKASCSINIVDMLLAIDNAFKSEHMNTFKTSSVALTAGLVASSTVKDSSKDDAKNVKLTTDYAAVVLADGKVVAAILDTAEPELKAITAEAGATELAYKGTKREQGEDYGMMTSGTWYVQADAYVKAAIGKTAADIATLASEGVAGCTIYAGGYKAGIEAAVAAAK